MTDEVMPSENQHSEKIIQYETGSLFNIIRS